MLTDAVPQATVPSPVDASAGLHHDGGALTQLTCVFTRFELKHAWQMPLMWWHFRRVHRSVVGAPGLLRSRLLLESPRCVYTLSVWTDPRAIEAISKSVAHVEAVHAAQRWAARIWSGQWHLTRLSPSARSWPGGMSSWSDLARASGVGHAYPAPFVRCLGPPIFTGRRREREPILSKGGDDE